MLVIDGSQGEGGGQIIRSALALSLVTGQPFRIDRIRAGREQPGLKRQHLVAVEAAREIGEAQVVGAELRSRSLEFRPGQTRGGNYHFRIQSAGSSMLVLQTVLPALMVAASPTQLVLEGGTHNPWAPPFDFLQKSFVPLIQRLGPTVDLRLERHGFYPAGGGRVRVSVRPASQLTGFDLQSRGAVIQRRVRAILSSLSRDVGQREINTALRRLDWPLECGSVESVESAGPGNALLAEVACEQITEVFVAFGERGRAAEDVAASLAKEVRSYLLSDAPLGEYLADQWLLPLGLAVWQSRKSFGFRATTISSHFQTHLSILRDFLGLQSHIEHDGERAYQVRLAMT